MRKRLYMAVGFLAAVAVCTPAAAQMTTAMPPQAAGPAVNLWYVGGVTGVTLVKSAGALGGAEAGVRAWKHLDIFVEGGRFSNVVTSREAGLPKPLVEFLGATQGKAASSSVTVPANYFAVGGRWVFEDHVWFGRSRFYVQGAIGGANVDIRSSFALGGTDITGSLSQYGVTLGSDLRGRSNHVAFGGGAGLLTTFGRIYVELRRASDKHSDPGTGDQRRSSQYRRGRQVLEPGWNS